MFKIISNIGQIIDIENWTIDKFMGSILDKKKGLWISINLFSSHRIEGNKSFRHISYISFFSYFHNAKNDHYSQVTQYN